MVIRVVFALAAAALAVPALAADRLPYDIVNFTRTPAYAPQIGYDVGGLLYDRVPDHVALGYRLDGLTGVQPTYRVIRDYGPLDYDTDGLLAVIYASAPQDGARSAAD